MATAFRANCSQELVWGIVRTESCFLKLRKQSGRSGMGKMGAQFTTEPGNLTGKNAWKYSGLANAKTVSVEPAAEGKGVVVTKKVTNKDRVYKPGKSLAKQTLTKDFRRVAKSLKGTVSGTFYRPDLEKAALAKWSLIHASQKKK